MPDLLIPIQHVMATKTQATELRIPGAQTTARSTQLTTISALGLSFTVQAAVSGAVIVRALAGNFEYKQASIPANQVQTWMLATIDSFSAADFKKWLKARG